ncbi:MAG: hypothetical protein R3E68_10355 [Burkholderiaceae bacterium]
MAGPPVSRPAVVWAGLSLAIALLLALAIGQLVDQLPDERAIRIDQGVFVAGDGIEPPSDVLSAQAIPGAVSQALPHDWRASQSARVGWYVLEIDLRVAPDRLWAVWLPRVAHNATVYLNGTHLGRPGLQEQEARNWNEPVYLLIANGLLEPGRNTLAIRVQADRPGAGFLREVYLGPHQEISGYHWRASVFRVHVLQAILGLMLLSAAFASILWYWRRSDSLFGWFAILNVCWVLHDLYQVIPQPASASILLDWYWHATLVVFVYSVVIFTNRFLDVRPAAFEKRLLAWAVLMPLIMLAIALSVPEAFYRLAAPVSDTVALLISVSPFVMMSAKVLRMGTSVMAGMMAAGALPLGFGVHDWLVNTALLRPDYGYLMPFGSVLILLVFGMFLTRRFGNALSELESLNAELELRIELREQIIAENFRRLQHLETERAILDERGRLMRDMHDGVGGTLISTLAMVQAGGTNPELLEQALRGAIEDLRLMIDSLDPVDGDLNSVLANLRSRMEPRLLAAGLRLEWAVQDLPPMAGLGPNGVLQIMRIVQEAINNVLKHANARTIRLACGLSSEADRAARHLTGVDPLSPVDAPSFGRAAPVVISLTDDGIGLPDGTRQGGKGLANMRRRAKSIGASVSVVPAEPGTCVMIEIPAQGLRASPLGGATAQRE